MTDETILMPSEVREFRAETHWSRARLAREAGLSVNALRDMDDPDWSPQIRTLRRLSDFILAHRKAHVPACQAEAAQ